ncbi:hypothetical protein Tco_0861707 [Tanacetum coccineum]|uniref:Integrase, catalytic region, zinc finger, CCHC-type, peptidase aspartic, catalytic n=1 Tax=Tanacetum coccineum TaxID=301880 RepID=A0ABQ5BIL0_9ASTR
MQRNLLTDTGERELFKLYDEFDKFDYKKGESLHEFYLRFLLLLNDMNIYNVKLGGGRQTSVAGQAPSRDFILREAGKHISGKQRTIDTTPIDYVALNKDFSTRFVPQTELSAKQAFWSKNSVNSLEPTLSFRPTNVEVLKELPKVSMVNTSLKKLKYHLANFDVDLFSTFNQHLVDELSEVQNVFYQMEQAVEQHRIESKTFEVKMNQVLNENERLLEQVMSKDIVNLLVNPSVENDSVNVHECQKCLKLETELQTDFVKRETYDKLFKSFTILEKHCISLEVDTQLKQEIFQRENSVSNQSVPSFDQLFELNELKAQSQEKDTVIKKLKERIKSLSGKMDKDKIKQDLEEIETINIELDHRVTKLIAENEHLKQTYKQLYDSIKPARIRSKEQCDDLINQVNIKSAEISDLNASLQEKALAITALKDELRKLKGKALVDNNVSNHPSDPELHQVNVEPITPKLLNKRTAHSAYIKHSQEEAAVLRDLVDHIKANYPLDPLLESACKYTKLIQEMLSKISKTCPSINSSGEQLVAVTPMNKVKRVRFTEPVTSSRNTKTAHTSNLASNKPMLSSTGVKQSTSASGSQPLSNTKKDKIQQTQSRILNNKVEAHPRKVKSSLKNKDCVVASKGTAHVQHSKLNANYKLKCVKCNGCMLYDNHDLCVLDFINNVNARAKSRSTFTIVGNVCPLTRITTTTEVPLRKSSALDNKTPKLVVTLVYSRKPRKSKTSVPVNNYKVIKSVTANNSKPSIQVLERVNCVLRISGLYTSRCLMRNAEACLGQKKDQIDNLLKEQKVIEELGKVRCVGRLYEGDLGRLHGTIVDFITMMFSHFSTITGSLYRCCSFETFRYEMNMIEFDESYCKCVRSSLYFRWEHPTRRFFLIESYLDHRFIKEGG